MMQCKIATGLLIMGLSLITMPITAQEYVNCLEIPNTSPYEVMKCQQEQLRTFHKDNQKLRNDIKKLQAATAESNKAQIQMQSQIKKLRSQMPQDQQNGKYSLVIKSDTCSNRVWFADIETLPLGNIFLDIRANFTHCGGGCFWAFRHLQVLFNSYTHQHILSDINKHGNGAGKWSFLRIVTRKSEHGGHSEKLRIQKSVGTVPYCGPVNVWIESNVPIKLLSKSE